jgi:hemolysin activation/secretion protein
MLAAFQVQAQVQASQRPDEQPRFDILEFVVEGDTLLGNAAIERAVYEFLGPSRGVADAESARKALEKAYQDAGFLSVSVVLPPQRVGESGGEVRLRVVQAPVDKLRVTGAQYTLPSAVKAALPSLAPGNVPNFNEMQQELAQFSRASADREITPLLAAGEQPGTLNVELKLQDTLPLHGSVELNSKQSQNTRAGRLEAGIDYANLFQRGHAVGLSWYYSPTRPTEADIQSLNYNLPLGGLGDRLYFALVNSNSNTPTSLGGATVSRGQTFRLRWRDELPDRAGLNHGLTWGSTWRHLRDRNDNVAGVTTETPSLRYATFSLAYDLQLQGSVSGRSTGLQAELTISPPGLNRRDVDCGDSGVIDQFACKRYIGVNSAGQRQGASAGFQVLGLSLSHREPLGQWALSGRLQAQITDTPLIPSEQVVYGGADSVRGYYEGEQSGDLGAALRIQLDTPSWALSERTAIGGSIIWDNARLRRLYALPSETADTRMGSLSLGARLTTGFGLQATLHWARVLVDTSRLDSLTGQQPVSGSAAGREQRWDFSLRQSF